MSSLVSARATDESNPNAGRCWEGARRWAASPEWSGLVARVDTDLNHAFNIQLTKGKRILQTAEAGVEDVNQ